MKVYLSTIVLSLVALCIGLYAYFFEYRARIQEKEVKAQESIILKIDKQNIQEIEIHANSQDLLLVKNEDSKWGIKKPIEDRAEPLAVSGLIDELLSEKSEMEIADPEVDLGAFGLEKPQGFVRVKTSDGKQTVVQVGDNALEGKLYVKLADDKSVLLAGPGWNSILSKSLSSLRNKRIPDEGFVVQKISWQNLEKKSPSYSISRVEDKMTLESVKFATDQDKINQYVNAFNDLMATEVVAEDKTKASIIKKYHLNKPILKVMATDKDNKVSTLLFSVDSKEPNHAFVTIDSKPFVYKIMSSQLKNFQKVAQDFRDKKLPFKFDASNVEELVVESGDVKIELVKKGDTWNSKIKDEEKEVDQTQVAQLISRLQELTAKDFLGDQRFSPQKKQFILKSKEGKELLHLNVGKQLKNKNETEVKSSLSDEIITVESHMIQSLPVQTLLKSKNQVRQTESQPTTDASAPVPPPTDTQEHSHAHN